MSLWKKLGNLLLAPRHIWTFSGITVGHRNALGDGGVIVGAYPMTERAALKHVSTLAPRGAVCHVDRVNHIITYKVT